MRLVRMVKYLQRGGRSLIPCLLSLICYLTFSLPVLAQREIVSVQPVAVDCAVGQVPALPWQVWVTYADGGGEWRQVRWANSAPQAEADEADAALHPVGSSYEVAGYVTGDNATGQGWPLVAQVTVVESERSAPAPLPVAEPLPLGDVQLTGDNRLTWNRDRDIDMLLALDVRQQLYNYRDTYGLPTDGFPESDGWDSPTTKLKGHGTGHYLSALAFAFASQPAGERRDSLRSRMQTMVDEMRRCQERTMVWSDSLGRYWEARDLAPEEELRQMQGTWAAMDEYKRHCDRYGYGYLNAIPAQHAVLIEMYRAYNNNDWVWAPYYTIHKQLAGLIDIATCVDDKALAEKALCIARDMGLWVWNRLHYRTFVSSEGTQEERRARPGNRYEMWNMYIAGEVGGISESLARLAELTDDAQQRERLIEAAGYFDSPAFYDPLTQNIDAIRTRHANQHIPMVVGALRSYRTNGQARYYRLAENFWQMIQGRYRYAMGGVGNGEMFRQPYAQIMSMCTNLTSDPRGNRWPEPTMNETCCAYNLAKLTKELNGYRPNEAAYMDYYERVLYNQIVGSIHPLYYATCYQYAVGLNAEKPWGNETPQSSCCGGTGSENHVKYQEAAYFVGGDTLWVALYLPTHAQWRAKGVTIDQDCQWPAEQSTIRVSEGGTFAMKLRVPYWATGGFSIKLNGQEVATPYQPGTYAEIPLRRWEVGDVVEVEMPFSVHLDFGPDKMRLAATGRNETQTAFEPRWAGAVMYGPLVMAAEAETWEEATLDLSSQTPGERLTPLDPAQADIPLAGTKPDPDAEEPGPRPRRTDEQRVALTPREGDHLVLLTDGTRTFLPDYYADSRLTHYFRLALPGQDALGDEAPGGGEVSTDALFEQVQMAKGRRDAQEAWMALEVKVPEYAPWAPHAYARMLVQYEAARQLLADPQQNTQQELVDRQTAQLEAALSAMRPGNLPELEDLDELLPLIEQVRGLERTAEREAAISYAEMVVKYVSDGSGTMDMISKATEGLQGVLR